MNKRLSQLFSVSYFVSLIEMSLFNAYFSLFLVQIKHLSPPLIASILSLNFLMSLIVGPMIGKLFEIYGSSKMILASSLIEYIISVLAWLIKDSLIAVIGAYILYNIAKTPILRLQDMLAVQSHYEGKIDYGKSRSFAAIGYALAPLIATTMFTVFTDNKVNYLLVFGMMSVAMFVNYWILSLIMDVVSLKSQRKMPNRVRISKEQWSLIVFIVVSNMFFNGTNNYSVSFQTVYLESIFKTTSMLGSVILIGSLLEWPMMQKATRIYEYFGNKRVLIVLSFIVSLRWFAYYLSGVYESYSLFYIAASLNGVAQALYVPFSSTYLRKISQEESYARVYTVVGFLGSIASTIFAQGIAIASNYLSMQDMFLMLMFLTLIWSLYLMVENKKIV